MKRYKAKSIQAAEKQVAILRKKCSEQAEQIRDLTYERVQLAKLAADTPQFSDPMFLWAVKKLRDRILQEETTRANAVCR